jgi:hypothetical protein
MSVSVLCFVNRQACVSAKGYCSWWTKWDPVLMPPASFLFLTISVRIRYESWTRKWKRAEIVLCQRNQRETAEEYDPRVAGRACFACTLNSAVISRACSFDPVTSDSWHTYTRMISLCSRMCPPVACIGCTKCFHANCQVSLPKETWICDCPAGAFGPFRLNIFKSLLTGKNCIGHKLCVSSVWIIAVSQHW